MLKKKRGMNMSLPDASHLGPSSLRLGPRLKSLGKTWRKQPMKDTSRIGHPTRNSALAVREDLSEISSSAHSNTQKVIFGERELETLKGTKISGLSPITRHMNAHANTTLKQMDQADK